MTQTEAKQAPSAGSTGKLIALGVKDSLAPIQYKLFGTKGALGCKPTKVNIEITYRCCLRCQMCDKWRENGEGELSVEQWIAVIDDLNGWLSGFRLTVTGGEPLMKPGIWEFLEHCCGLGLPTTLVTNGYLLGKKQLERLAQLRLAQVSLSVDGIDREKHDSIRGVPGAFERTWNALTHLASAPRSFVLASSTTIIDENILQLEQIADALADAGVERMFFQPVQAGFADDERLGPLHLSPLWPSTPDRVNRGIDALLAAKQRGVPLANSEKELEAFRQYLLAGPSWVRPTPCSALYDTLDIDAYGNTRICATFARRIGNISSQKPREVWESELAKEERQIIAKCTEPCLLNCTRTYSMGEKVQYAAMILSKRFLPGRSKTRLAAPTGQAR
jgi:MoaA/NifB/PqqE/SkfB family radical SAM enzyme